MSRLPTQARKLINRLANEHAERQSSVDEENAVYDAMVQDAFLETIARAYSATITLEGEAQDRDAADVSSMALDASDDMLLAADNRAEKVADEAAKEAREMEA